MQKFCKFQLFKISIMKLLVLFVALVCFVSEISAQETTCPSYETQCPTGCCPFAQGVCCIDGLFCCHHDQTCIPFTGICIGLQSTYDGNKTIISESAVAVKKVDLSHEASCPSNETKCPTGCCPYVDAVCCQDGLSCCQHGQTCTPSGLCIGLKPTDDGNMTIIYDYEKSVAVKRVDNCPAGMTDCPPGCCPLPNAVCCTDKIHCCPDGYECTSDSCIRKSEPRGNDTLPLEDHGISWELRAHEASCPSNETECTNGCCPFSDAVCCSDGCCPHGAICLLDFCIGLKSTDDGKMTVTSEKPVAVKRRDTTRKLKAYEVSCPSNETVCPTGCCPHVDGVCCDDGRICCQHGHTCASFGLCIGFQPTDDGNMTLISEKPAAVKSIDHYERTSNSCIPKSEIRAKEILPLDDHGIPRKLNGQTGDCCTTYAGWYCCPDDYPVCTFIGCWKR